MQHTFEIGSPRGRVGFLVLATAWALVAALSPVRAHAACLISGPTTAVVSQSFTLCGPSVSGYTYEWYGSGLSSTAQSRCVDVDGLTRGAYEFVLVRKVNGVEVDRCTKIVNVGGSTGGVTSCQISGPEVIDVGAVATLCAPEDGLHTYSWSGPGGFTASSACITVDQEGTYTLNTRNRLTGSSRTCTRHLTVNGQAVATNCDIIGPTTIVSGTSERLCAPSFSNTSYRWTGPNGFVATSRCVTVDEAGTYSVTLRNLRSGQVDRCSQTLTYNDANGTGGGTGGSGGYDNPDAVVSDNCPRDFQFWRGVCDQTRTSGSGSSLDLSRSELQTLARAIDDRSSYFNWSNDLDGFCQALNPGRPLTRRKQIIRQYAALLANVVAGERGYTTVNGDNIGLDPDTAVSFGGASTIGELIALTDRLLRGNRGDFTKLNATLNNVNRGRGIGPVCE